MWNSLISTDRHQHHATMPVVEIKRCVKNIWVYSSPLRKSPGTRDLESASQSVCLEVPRIVFARYTSNAMWNAVHAMPFPSLFVAPS